MLACPFRASCGCPLAFFGEWPALAFLLLLLVVLARGLFSNLPTLVGLRYLSNVSCPGLLSRPELSTPLVAVHLSTSVRADLSHVTFLTSEPGSAVRRSDDYQWPGEFLPTGRGAAGGMLSKCFWGQFLPVFAFS